MKMMEKVGEGAVEQELAENQEPQNGTLFDILRSIILPCLGEMWFLTADPVVRKPMILEEFVHGKNCREFLQEA